jgi:phosphosulfolactate synthase (CoM biosynthesis protein A)
MDKETILKCIELTDDKFQHYYNEAKRVGQFDAVKEQEYVRAAMALKELKDELFEMWHRSYHST